MGWTKLKHSNEKHDGQEETQTIERESKNEANDEEMRKLKQTDKGTNF